MALRTYDAHRHEEALAQHDRRWREMRAARREHSTDSVEYWEAHRSMIEAKRIVEIEGRRRRKRGAFL